MYSKKLLHITLIATPLFTTGNAVAHENKAFKIAVLNSCNLKENHINRLRNYGQVIVYNDTDTQQKAIERLKGIDIAIADPYKISYNQQLFESTNTLKLVSIGSSGFNMVDVAAARKNGISVANAAGYSTDAVAEHTIGLMLAVVRKIPLIDKMLRNDPFEVNSNNPAHQSLISYNLRGKILGIIGFGNIGKRVAQLGQAFGMHVIAYNRSPQKMDGVTMVELEELLKKADIISIHLPLSQETENLIGEKQLGLMKSSAIILNTSRGKIINSQELYNALKNKKISGAGLDVLDEVNPKNPLLKLDNVVLTPHSGAFTEESLPNMANIIVHNVISFTQNNPINIVN